MTPKETYEGRRAAKRQERERYMNDRGTGPDKAALDLMEVLDRIAEAVERIADVLEKKS